MKTLFITMAAKVTICLQIKRLGNFFGKNFKGLIPRVCIKLSPYFITISGAKSYQSRASHVIELFAEAIAQAQVEKRRLNQHFIGFSAVIMLPIIQHWYGRFFLERTLPSALVKGTSEIQDFN